MAMYRNLSIQDPEEDIQALLSSIKETLQTIDARTWRCGGGPLDSSKKHKQPLAEWHWVFCINVDNQVLVVRSVQPVTAEFAGFGFSFVPNGVCQYFVEMRAKGFHPEILTDIQRRTEFSNKFCRVLASGQTAQQLFQYTRETFETQISKHRKNFLSEVDSFLMRLPELLSATAAGDWQQSEAKGGIRYSTKNENWEISIFREFEEEREVYGLHLAKEGTAYESRNPGIVRSLFAELDQKCKLAGLHTVREVLRKIV